MRTYLDSIFVNTWELELSASDAVSRYLCSTTTRTVLNVSEVASNVPLLRWPLRQGYLETPLCGESVKPVI